MIEQKYYISTIQTPKWLHKYQNYTNIEINNLALYNTEIPDFIIQIVLILIKIYEDNENSRL